eukprot:SAG22_NODE_2589_length_2410_cov_1.832540_4_plen_116_part_00
MVLQPKARSFSAAHWLSLWFLRSLFERWLFANAQAAAEEEAAALVGPTATVTGSPAATPDASPVKQHRTPVKSQEQVDALLEQKLASIKTDLERDYEDKVRSKALPFCCASSLSI